MATFRDKNHQLGSSIQGALRLTEITREDLKCLQAVIPPKEYADLIKYMDLLRDTVYRIANQTDEIKSIAYRFLDPDKPLAEVETVFREQNQAYKLLVVEDDQTVRESTQKFFEKRGFVVRTADGADTACQLIEAEKPDVVLLDLALPSVDDGLRVLKFQKERSSSIKTIIVTKLDDDSLMSQVMALEPAKILNKPVPIAQLIAQVNAVVQKMKA